ncbi:MAG: hypothetical protein ACOYJ2_06355 [Rickettsiales bacterium]
MDYAFVRMRRISALMTIACTASIGSLTVAYAQDFMTLETVPIEQVTDYRSQPLALLARFPEAGTAMARYVADLVSKQPSIVESIMNIITDATPDQAAAIGAGVARSLRALSETQPEVTASITKSSLSANNPWYKTTFRAIDAGYSQNAPVIIPDPIPPVPLSTGYVGLELPEGEGRVGPARIGQPIPQGFKPFGNKENSDMLVRRGMIVAIMASDKEKNGAVSTSPTQ